LGGTDYTSALSTTLIADAVTLARTMNPSERRTAIMSIYRQNAVAAGATIPNPINEIVEAVECLQNYQDLDSVELLLLCKLGVHKAFPQ
jgi:hypothetical protein